MVDAGRGSIPHLYSSGGNITVDGGGLPFALTARLNEGVVMKGIDIPVRRLGPAMSHFDRASSRCLPTLAEVPTAPNKSHISQFKSGPLAPFTVSDARKATDIQ